VAFEALSSRLLHFTNHQCINGRTVEGEIGQTLGASWLVMLIVFGPLHPPFILA
jgi:hypothetical protein